MMQNLFLDQKKNLLGKPESLLAFEKSIRRASCQRKKNNEICIQYKETMGLTIEDERSYIHEKNKKNR